MPVRCGKKDSKGTYCQWGSRGAHYYYTPGNKDSMARARKKAAKQGAAAHAHGYRGAERHSDIQSLRFDKKKFNRAQAVTWAKSHGFKSGDVEEKPNEWRLRQFPPERCTRSGGMKDLSSGVRGYICPIRKSKLLDKSLIILKNITNIIDALYSNV